MKLDRITVALRPRTPWEAVDLGFAMVRAWWRPMMALWLVTVLPVWILGLGLLYRWPVLSLLFLWWLRPVFDRAPLFYVSRSLFGAPPSLAETLRVSLRPGWTFTLSYLTVLRFDIARSFNLPVWQLEGLRGRARGQRLRILNLYSRGTAVCLTAASLLLEVCLLGGGIALLSLLAPPTMRIPWQEIFTEWRSADGSLGAHLLFGGVWFLAFTLIEMAYVAAGFALYVSRRVQLEGWDIELTFRKLAARVARQRRREASRRRAVQAAGAPVLGLALLLAGGLLAGPLPSTAAEPPPDDPAAPASAIGEILSRPEFRTSREVRRWRLKEAPEDRERPDGIVGPSDLGPLAALVQASASLLEILLWVAVAVAAAGLVYHFSRGAKAPRGEVARPPPAAPETLFGLDLRPETLPSDVAGSALELLAAGKLTEALSLLYRGTLARLVHRGDLEVEASWTEADCLARARPRLPAETFEVFRRLTGDWCRTAYAHRPPEPQALEGLCREWRQAFGGGAP